MSEVVVAATGVANLASVVAALERAGARPRVTASAADVDRADLVVLPGVGSFGAAMDALRGAGLAGAVAGRARRGRPLLAICLGMQLLAEGSGESPGVAGLGAFPGVAGRFQGPVRIPQLGWNHVVPAEGSGLLRPGWASFANSYRLERLPDGWTGALANYAGPFVAAVERGPVLGCQFHPELSAEWGLALIRRWMDVSRSGQWSACPAGARRGWGERRRVASGQWVTRATGARNVTNDTSVRPVTGVTNVTRAAGVAGVGGVALRIVPCLDCSGGRVVKGVRFAGLRDAGDPVERAAAYEAQGADELVLLDVSATPEGRGHQLETVRAVRRVLGIPLTVGGGVRTTGDVARLLEAGADKVAVNTAAVRDPSLLSAMAERFGVQCTVLAIDARRADGGERGADATDVSGADGGRRAHAGGTSRAGDRSRRRGARDEVRDGSGAPVPLAWEVVVESGRTRAGCDAVAWAAEAEERGAGEILLTSFDRDGTREGYDLELLGAVSRAVRVPVIASGGAETPEHLLEAVEAGADAVLAASIFHDGDRTVAELKAHLAARGVPVRGGARL